MAHYAVLDSDLCVVNVFVGRDEDDLAEGVIDWQEYYAPEGFTVKRTSYNTSGGVHSGGGEPFRGNFASIGMSYDPELDAFIPAQPFPSWSLNTETFTWQAPVPRPEGDFVWDEKSGAWAEA